MQIQEALGISYQQAAKMLAAFCDNNENFKKTAELAQHFATAFRAGNKLLTCGNGGSACDSMHFAEELTGRYRKNRKPLPALALADPSHITCVANDFGYDEVFARGVTAFGKSGDWLIVLSTSGNSKNVIRAVEEAKVLGVRTLGLLGKGGGQLKGQCDYEFIIEESTSDRIQELHMTILHILVEGVERVLFPEHYQTT